MILIFFLSANLLFSRNIAVLLGDFKTVNGSYMNKIATMLKRRGFEVINTLQVDTSTSFSSSEQGNEVAEKLLKSYGLNNHDNLILIAHGQGGLRAIETFKILEFANDLMSLNINTKAIFTIATPWQGVSILNERDKIIDEIVNTIDNLDKCREYINIIGKSIGLTNNKIEEYIEAAKSVKTIMQDSLNCLGLKDILPNSEFINSLNNFRKEIIIFNIVSYYDSYEPNMSAINKYKEQINKLVEYAKKLSVINSILLMDKTLTSNKLTTDASKQVIYASKLVNNLISLLNELIEFNKEDNNRVLTVKEQQLPDKLNEAQCKLRNKEGTLGYVVKGVHRSLTDNNEGTVYDSDEVVDYISRSIDNNFNPVLKDEDVR